MFTTLYAAKNQATEGSYKVSQCTLKYGKPFSDGEFIKEAFQKSPNTDQRSHSSAKKSRDKGLTKSVRLN